MRKKYYNKSGLYFRGLNVNTNKIEPICFEELSQDEQVEQMKNRSTEWYCAMIERLCNTINELNDGR